MLYSSLDMEPAKRILPVEALDLIMEYVPFSLEAFDDALVEGKYRVGYYSSRDVDWNPIQADCSLPNREAAFDLLEFTLHKYFLPYLREITGWYSMTDTQRAALISYAWTEGRFFFNDKKNEKSKEMRSALWTRRWDAVGKIFTKEPKTGKLTPRWLFDLRQAEREAWFSPSRNSLKRQAFVQAQRDEVHVGIPFKVCGTFSPEYHGHFLVHYIDGMIQETDYESLVDVDGMWEMELTLEEPGKHSLGFRAGSCSIHIEVMALEPTEGVLKRQKEYEKGKPSIRRRWRKLAHSGDDVKGCFDEYTVEEFTKYLRRVKGPNAPRIMREEREEEAYLEHLPTDKMDALSELFSGEDDEAGDQWDELYQVL